MSEELPFLRREHEQFRVDVIKPIQEDIETLKADVAENKSDTATLREGFLIFKTGIETANNIVHSIWFKLGVTAALVMPFIVLTGIVLDHLWITRQP